MKNFWRLQDFGIGHQNIGAFYDLNKQRQNAEIVKTKIQMHEHDGCQTLEASKLQQRNATKPRVNTARGVPLVGKGKPSLGAHKAKQPPGRALTQRGTTQRRPAR